jgi:hypothetical protein
MKPAKHLTFLMVLSQITGLFLFVPASRADSQKDIELLIGYVKQTGTKVQKTDKCESSMMGFYQAPTQDGTGDRLVFCSNNIDFNDTSAVWEVLAHESAHVMQACNGSLLWKETYHPRMLRRLKEQAPHYAEILNQYRGRDKMMELEAFDMELKPASEVITLFAKFCSGDNQQPSSAASGSDSAESILSIVGGEESFKALLAWAKNNLSQQELQQLAATLKSENVPAIKRALVALMNRFNQAQSYENYRLF